MLEIKTEDIEKLRNACNNLASMLSVTGFGELIKTGLKNEEEIAKVILINEGLEVTQSE